MDCIWLPDENEHITPFCFLLGWTEGSLLFWGPRIGALSFISRRKHTARKRKEKTYPGKTYWWKGHLSTHLGSIFFYWLVSTQVHEIMRFCFQNTEPPYRRPQVNSADLLDEHQLSAQCNFFGKKDKPLYVQGTFQILLFQLYSINPSYVTSCLPNCQEACCQ